MAEENSPARLATYGTLAPGRPNHHQLEMMEGEWIVGTVKGRLVQAGWGAEFGFPGLVIDPDGQDIKVMVFTSDDLQSHWERLDRFEGDGYRRIEATIATENGDITASVYVVGDIAQAENVSEQPKSGIHGFPLKTSDKLRYADTDRQGHVNNAVFATFLETGRVEVLLGDGLAEDGAAFVIARLELDFLAEVNWPGSVEIGTAVKEIGRSSFKLFQQVFQNGIPVAQATTVIVQMNEDTRKSQPLSERARNRLGDLLRLASDT